MPRLKLAIATVYAVLAASVAASSLVTTSRAGDLAKPQLDARLLAVAVLVAAAFVTPLFSEGFKELFRQVIKRRRRGPWWLLPLAVLLQLALIISPFILLVGLMSRYAPRLPEIPKALVQPPDSAGAQQPDQSGEPNGGAIEEPSSGSAGEEVLGASSSSSWPMGAVVGVLLTLAAVVVVYAALDVWFESRGSRPEDGLADAGELELLQATREAIQEVEEGGDPRGAIVSYFLKLCRLLQEQGVAVSEEMTAREVAFAALKHFERLDPDHIERLVRLFEEARYSDHHVDERARRVALACFTAIRDSLTGEGIGG